MKIRPVEGGSSVCQYCKASRVLALLRCREREADILARFDYLCISGAAHRSEYRSRFAKLKSFDGKRKRLRLSVFTMFLFRIRLRIKKT